MLTMNAEQLTAIVEGLISSWFVVQGCGFGNVNHEL